MVGKISIVRYEDKHGEYIGNHMRASDRKEMYYLALLAPAAAIRITVGLAETKYTALVDDVPALMWGVSRRTILSDVGVPWLLGTDVAEQYQFKFGRETRTYFAEMASLFPVMENYALAENRRALRWIKWTGFDTEEAKPYGAFMQKFVRFGKGLSCA